MSEIVIIGVISKWRVDFESTLARSARLSLRANLSTNTIFLLCHSYRGTSYATHRPILAT